MHIRDKIMILGEPPNLTQVLIELPSFSIDERRVMTDRESPLAMNMKITGKRGSNCTSMRKSSGCNRRRIFISRSIGCPTRSTSSRNATST
jgi:hypothetical protein